MTYFLIDRWTSSRFLRDLFFALKKINMLIFYSIDSNIYVVDKTATNLFWFISTSQSETMRTLIAQKTHLWDLLCEFIKQVFFVATQSSQKVRITSFSLRIMFVRRCRFWRLVIVEKNAEKEMREKKAKEMKENAIFCLFCVSSASYISVSITHQWHIDQFTIDDVIFALICVTLANLIDRTHETFVSCQYDWWWFWEKKK